MNNNNIHNAAQGQQRAAAWLAQQQHENPGVGNRRPEGTVGHGTGDQARLVNGVVPQNRQPNGNGSRATGT